MRMRKEQWPQLSTDEMAYDDPVPAERRVAVSVAGRRVHCRRPRTSATRGFYKRMRNCVGKTKRRSTWQPIEQYDDVVGPLPEHVGRIAHGVHVELVIERPV